MFHFFFLFSAPLKSTSLFDTDGGLSGKNHIMCYCDSIQESSALAKQMSLSFIFWWLEHLFIIIRDANCAEKFKSFD